MAETERRQAVESDVENFTAICSHEYNVCGFRRASSENIGWLSLSTRWTVITVKREKARIVLFIQGMVLFIQGFV